MKSARFLMYLFVAVLMIHPNVWADQAIATQIQNLALEMQKMRQDYESRITDLQSQISDLQKNQTKEMAKIGDKMGETVDKAVEEKLLNVDYVGRNSDDPYHKGGLVAETHHGFGKVSVGGYADIELENFQNRYSTFDQHRWILNIGAELGERLRFFSEYEIEHGGPNAAGGGEAKVEQAWIDFLIHDLINFRAGALLVPFGRYNLNHDSDLQDLTDRPLLARDIIPTTWTESGAGFHGGFNPTIGGYEDLEIDYEFYFINGLSAGFSDTGLRGARGSLESDNNNHKSIVGRVVASPSIGHEVGVSGYFGDFNGEDDAIRGIGVDFLTTWGPLEVLGEWAYFGVDQPGLIDVADDFQGMYLQANYHFWFDFLNESFLGRTFDDPTFTLVGRFDWAEIEDDIDADLGDNEELRWTLGINYRPVESWVFKLEYQNNHTDVETLERGDSEGFIASIAMGF